MKTLGSHKQPLDRLNFVSLSPTHEVSMQLFLLESMPRLERIHGYVGKGEPEIADQL